MLSSLVLTLALSAQTPSQTPAPAPEPPPVGPRLRLEDYLPPVTDTGRSPEEAAAFVERNGEDDLPVTSAGVEMMARADLSRTALSVAFNWGWLASDGERRPVWFARLRAVTWGGSIERFADARTCPGVAEALARIDALPAIEPRVPQPPDPHAPPEIIDLGGAYLHDNTYRVRLRGMFPTGQFSQRLEISGGTDAPLAPLFDDVLSRLKPCWSETPPPRA
jgi:hypothetical protein